MARLVLYPGTPQARPLVLKDGVNTLGRGEGNDFTIPDPSVSTSHCELTISNGVVRLRDLGSTNGTFVNGVAVTETTLEAGQQLQLGGVQAVFDVAPEPMPIQAPTTARVAVATAAPAAVRLRIAHATDAPPAPSAVPEAAAAPVEPPPVPVPETPANARCKYHPRTLARWVCTSCHKTYCDLCVAARPGHGTGQMFCRSCGGLAAALQVVIEAPKPKSFFRELPRAWIYPFRGTGVMMLIAATIVFAVLDFLSLGFLGWFVKAIALGYLFSYVQNIIHSTAAEDDRLPDLPGMDDVWGGFFRLIGTVLMSFGPALLAAYFAIFEEQPAAGIALIPAVIFGCLYFPMAFLAVAIKDNAMASNPLIVVPSILRVPLEYLVTAILLAGVFAVRWAGDAISGSLFGRSLMTESITEMFLLFGLRALWAFISVYLLTVTIRILGLLYLTKREKLEW